jgi:hypothetical protein
MSDVLQWTVDNWWTNWHFWLVGSLATTSSHLATISDQLRTIARRRRHDEMIRRGVGR